MNRRLYTASVVSVMLAADWLFTIMFASYVLTPLWQRLMLEWTTTVTLIQRLAAN